MTVADTSALLAVVFAEEDASTYAAALEARYIEVSAATMVEAFIVAEGRYRDPAHPELLERLLARCVDRVVPFDERHARAAVEAWQRFGKGRHRASLNLADCFSYATARLSGSSLLFKGDDFSKTDLVSALS